MGPARPVFDTNILIDDRNGVPPAGRELARSPAAAIRPVTWVEVLTGAAGADEERRVRSFLGRFHQVPLGRAVAEAAVLLRREHRIRLPDAVLWATARAEGTLLVTRNTKDFPDGEPGIRIPYRPDPARTPAAGRDEASVAGPHPRAAGRSQTRPRRTPTEPRLPVRAGAIPR